MKQVVDAIEAGRCSVAISGALLRDADVMLALTRRAGMSAMGLSGQLVSPVGAVGDAGVARAVHAPGGVVLVVEPSEIDSVGLQLLGKTLNGAPNKPAVFVVSKSFNPLQYRFVFPGLNVTHIKGRGKSFLKGLPVPEITEAPAAAPKAKKWKIGESAPRFEFVGREEEVASLKDILSTGGPVVVSGLAGVGRRWVTEHAIAEAGLTRLPDFTIGRSAGADSLFARLAEITRMAGADGLAKCLSDAHTPLAAVTAAIESLKAAEGASGQVFVIDRLDRAMGREGDFFRKSRLEMLLIALLTNEYPLRIVFFSEKQPVFYREGMAEALRSLNVGGLKGRFFYDIFQSYKAPEFSRDKIGPIADRLMGHPMAARQYAVAVRNRPDGLKLLDDAKFLGMKEGDVEPLRKQLVKRAEKLDGELRGALIRIAHLSGVIDGSVLADLGISRKVRLALVSDGLLDMCGTVEARTYRVHPLVASAFRYNDLNDFKTQSELARLFEKLADAATGVERLAWHQQVNRCASNVRGQRRIGMDYPDFDSELDAVAALMRGQRPRFDEAERRLWGVLGADPSNSDAHLLKFEFLGRVDAKPGDLEAAFEEAMNLAPVPEVFHNAVGWHLSRRAHGKAMTAMERAVEMMPDESRLRTRLASLQLRAGRRPAAIENLEKAMALDPMLPDAYGLLGMCKRDEGIAKIIEAEELLREAWRLAPGDVVQGTRLVSLLTAIARVDHDKRNMLRDEAREIVEGLLRVHKESWDLYLLSCSLVREMEGGVERCDWLLKKAKKIMPRGDRRYRWSLERALVDLTQGKLDASESEIRQQAKRDPSNHRIFGALALLLEARGQFIPAHAEYLRARERTPRESLEQVYYDQELARLQAVIEAQAKGLDASVLASPKAQEAAADPAKLVDDSAILAMDGSGRSVRLRKSAKAAAVGHQAASPVDAAGEPNLGAEAALDAASIEAAVESADVEVEVAAEPDAVASVEARVEPAAEGLADVGPATEAELDLGALMGAEASESGVEEPTDLDLEGTTVVVSSEGEEAVEAADGSPAEPVAEDTAGQDVAEVDGESADSDAAVEPPPAG